MDEPFAPEVTELAKGLRFPEGPVVLPDGSIAVVEIAGGTIARCEQQNVERIADCGGGPNGAALGPDGALYICNNGGLEFREVPARGWLLPGDQAAAYSGGSIQKVAIEGGNVETLYDSCDGQPLHAPNDIVFDAYGNFWFTDHGTTRKRYRDWGAVYWAKPDGSQIRCVVDRLDCPNGIGLSPGGDRLFVSETNTARLWGYDVTEPGVVRTDPRKYACGGDLVIGLPGLHMFDSLAVDAEGYISVATMGQRCGITVVSSDGSRSEHIDLPDPAPTNICFGGPGLRTAFITLSATGRLISMPWERPGLQLAF